MYVSININLNVVEHRRIFSAGSEWEDGVIGAQCQWWGRRRTIEGAKRVSKTRNFTVGKEESSRTPKKEKNFFLRASLLSQEFQMKI